MPRTDKNRAEGFTLLEVLIAFALLAVTLGATHQVFGSGLKAVERAEQRAVAGLHAQALLDRLGLDLPLRPGTTEGRFEDGQAWRLTIAPRDPEAVGEQLYRVEAAVALGASDPADGAVLVTLRLGAGS